MSRETREVMADAIAAELLISKHESGYQSILRAVDFIQSTLLPAASRPAEEPVSLHPSQDDGSEPFPCRHGSTVCEECAYDRGFADGQNAAASEGRGEREEEMARAIHDTVTGCPELWAGTDKEPWREHARDVLAALPPCLRCDALAEDNRQLRETRAYWQSDLSPEAEQHYRVLLAYLPDEQEAHHRFAVALNALHTIAQRRASVEGTPKSDELTLALSPSPNAGGRA